MLRCTGFGLVDKIVLVQQKLNLIKEANWKPNLGFCAFIKMMWIKPLENHFRGHDPIKVICWKVWMTCTSFWVLMLALTRGRGESLSLWGLLFPTFTLSYGLWPSPCLFPQLPKTSKWAQHQVCAEAIIQMCPQHFSPAKLPRTSASKGLPRRLGHRDKRGGTPELAAGVIVFQ